MVLDSEMDGGVRMSSERLYLQDLKQMFFEEKNFADQEEYCRAYKLLFTGTAFVQAESDALGGIGCTEYDL
jgi:hypothetical protein